MDALAKFTDLVGPCRTLLDPVDLDIKEFHTHGP